MSLNQILTLPICMYMVLCIVFINLMFLGEFFQVIRHFCNFLVSRNEESNPISSMSGISREGAQRNKTLETIDFAVPRRGITVKNLGLGTLWRTWTTVPLVPFVTDWVEFSSRSQEIPAWKLESQKQWD